jgi:hypothetical protein
MTDSTTLPADVLARILPSLEALEAAFRPLAEQLTVEDESALTFEI